MDFWQNFDWMLLLRCFIVGGLICVVGQILIDKTKLTSARILVLFVTVGTILGGLGIYPYLIKFAGCGATVPLTGFGNNLAKGVMEAVKQNGLWGSINSEGKNVIEPKYNLDNNLLVDFIGKWHLCEDVSMNYYCER